MCIQQINWRLCCFVILTCMICMRSGYAAVMLGMGMHEPHLLLGAGGLSPAARYRAAQQQCRRVMEAKAFIHSTVMTWDGPTQLQSGSPVAVPLRPYNMPCRATITCSTFLASVARVLEYRVCYCCPVLSTQLSCTQHYCCPVLSTQHRLHRLNHGCIEQTSTECVTGGLCRWWRAGAVLPAQMVPTCSSLRQSNLPSQSMTTTCSACRKEHRNTTRPRKRASTLSATQVGGNDAARGKVRAGRLNAIASHDVQCDQLAVADTGTADD
eukprot:GHRQ01011541.1.p1 GENE.GHRQ01011541.1~~GHRQ01011541.1.p1  ORF type:complete len:268 (-),score=39.71 GHRQ01011541.1:423-1226(-)